MDVSNYSRHSDFSDWSDGRHRRMRRPFFGRSSRMSSTESRYSSDLDDEDNDDDDSFCEYSTFTGGKGRYSMIRKANSEPMLPSMTSSNPYGVEDNLVIIARRLQTASISNPANFVTDIIGGKLKSYSFDGVNANLPVPYRAKFRKKQFPNRNKYSDYQPTRSTYSPLKMSGSLTRRRNLFGRSHSESIPTRSSLSREVLEEQEEEDEEVEEKDVLRLRQDVTEFSSLQKLNGNLSNIVIRQELAEIQQNLPFRPASMSNVSEANTLTDSTIEEEAPSPNLEVSYKKKMFYVQSTETFDSDEEFDVNFMKTLEVKAAALSASQEFSRGVGATCDDFQQLIKRPISLSSLQKSVMLNPDEEHGGALRKWKATTNLQDLLAQFNSEEEDDDEEEAVPSSADDVSLEMLLTYESIADEMVFDAFCDAFVVLTEEIFHPVHYNARAETSARSEFPIEMHMISSGSNREGEQTKSAEPHESKVNPKS